MVAPFYSMYMGNHDATRATMMQLFQRLLAIIWQHLCRVSEVIGNHLATFVQGIRGY